MSPTSPNFSVSVTSDDTAHVLRAAGELDLHTRNELVTALDGLVRPPMIVVLDVTELSFIDSTGLKALLTEHRRARTAGYEFVLAGARGPVREALRLTALDITLPLADDVESVLDDRA